MVNKVGTALSETYRLTLTRIRGGYNMVSNSLSGSVLALSSSIALRATLAVTGGLIASQASASYTETTSTNSTYLYDFTDAVTGAVSGGDGSGNFANFRINGPYRSTPSAVAIDYHATISSRGAFDFLHNAQCFGYCDARIDTIIQSSITNLGTEALRLRFDTLVLPGHIGIGGTATALRAGFHLEIFESSVANAQPGQAPGPQATPANLYEMKGEVNGLGFADISGTGAPFNGLKYYENGLDRGFEWNATALSLFLTPIAPGETRLVSFVTSSFVATVRGCALESDGFCSGAQAAFGDPRNDGGGGGFSATDNLFAAFPSFMRFVPLNSPLPGAVPEPASWAMMIFGIAAIGGVMRRRTQIAHMV
jgi:hypothetical protein